MLISAQTVHDTIKIVKTIVDTVRVPSRDSMDLLTRVDAFYNNSWSKLLWFVAIFATLSTLITSWLQNKSINIEISKAVNEVHDKYKEKYRKDIEDLRTEVEASIILLQGHINLIHKHYADTVYNFIISIKDFLEADSRSNIKDIFPNLILALNNCKSTQIVTTLATYDTTFEIEIKMLRKLDKDNLFTADFDTIENIFKNLQQ